MLCLQESCRTQDGNCPDLQEMQHLLQLSLQVPSLALEGKQIKLKIQHSKTLVNINLKNTAWVGNTLSQADKKNNNPIHHKCIVDLNPYPLFISSLGWQ